MAMYSSGSPEKQNPQDGNTVGGGPGFAMVVGHPRTEIFKKKFFRNIFKQKVYLW